MPDASEHRQRLIEVARKDGRFHPAALEFVGEAVGHTARLLQARVRDGHGKHITGRELLEGFRQLALERFGCLALEVLQDWGLRATEDVGAVVFLMVENGLLGASEEDSPADFAGGYAFIAAFGDPFRPGEAPARLRLPRID